MRHLIPAAFLILAPLTAWGQSSYAPAGGGAPVPVMVPACLTGSTNAAGAPTVAPCGPSSPTYFVPGTYTPSPLDVSTVTTGGTAVQALTAAHVAKGGYIVNPPTATAILCVSDLNQSAAPISVTGSGLTAVCANSNPVLPGSQAGIWAGGVNPVTVVSPDNSHKFNGEGAY